MKIIDNYWSIPYEEHAGDIGKPGGVEAWDYLNGHADGIANEEWRVLGA